MGHLFPQILYTDPPPSSDAITIHELPLAQPWLKLAPIRWRPSLASGVRHDFVPHPRHEIVAIELAQGTTEPSVSAFLTIFSTTLSLGMEVMNFAGVSALPGVSYAYIAKIYKVYRNIQKYRKTQFIYKFKN